MVLRARAADKESWCVDHSSLGSSVLCFSNPILQKCTGAKPTCGACHSAKQICEYIEPPKARLQLLEEKIMLLESNAGSTSQAVEVSEGETSRAQPATVDGMSFSFNSHMSI
jgi:hypothetical protein